MEALGMGRKTGDRYLLKDTFSVDVAAGSVNNTHSDSGALRTIVDTNNKISITGGKLSFATGAVENDGVRYPVQVRETGKILKITITPANTSSLIRIGYDSNTSAFMDYGLDFTAAGNMQLYYYLGGDVAPIIGVYTATPYQISVIMRSGGYYWFIKGGAFTYWTLLSYMGSGSGNKYPGIQANSTTSIFTVDDIKIPPTLWLPTPLASDGFSIATLTDGLGHPETSGVGSGGSGLTWTGATWSVAGGVVSNTPTLEGDVVTNGNMETGDPPTGWNAGAGAVLDGVADERTGGAGAQSMTVTNGAANYGNANQTITTVVGKWYQLTFWIKRASGIEYRVFNTSVTPWISIDNTNGGNATTSWAQKRIIARCSTISTVLGAYTNTNILNDFVSFDDIFLLPITHASLFRSVVVANAHVKVRASSITFLTNTQFGVAARLASDKTSGIVLYWDRDGTIKLDEFTGSTTWSNLMSVAKAWATGNSIELDLSGTAFRCYHITAAGVTTLLGSGTCTVDGSLGTDAGIFSTDPTNTGDNFVVYAKGNSNEYAILDILPDYKALT